MPTKFADIDKPCKDILSDDYTSKFSVKAKKNAGPVGVTFETEQGKDGALATKVSTKYSYARFNIDKGQVKADGTPVVETSMKLSPDIKVSFKTTKGADLGIDYTKGGLYATGVLDCKDFSKVSTSACYSLPSGAKVGGSAVYSMGGDKSGLSAYGVGASYTKGAVFTSLTTSKFSSANFALGYTVNPSVTLASMSTHSSDKMFNVVGLGGSYKNPTIGTLKAKMGSDGVVHACLIKEIAPKVTLTASGSMSVTDPSTFKPGLGITM